MRPLARLMGMWWLILSGLAAVGAAVAVPLELRRRDARRWGLRREPHEVEPSPYRDATVHEEVEQRAPALVRFAASANAAWGMLTLLIFVPAGCLLLLFSTEEPLTAVALPPVLLSGFLLAFRLMGIAGALLTDDRPKLRSTVRWSVLHHLGVATGFAAAGFLFLSDREPLVGFLPAIPASVGLALALLLRAAARRGRRPEAAGSHE